VLKLQQKVAALMWRRSLFFLGCSNCEVVFNVNTYVSHLYLSSGGMCCCFPGEKFYSAMSTGLGTRRGVIEALRNSAGPQKSARKASSRSNTSGLLSPWMRSGVMPCAHTVSNTNRRVRARIRIINERLVRAAHEGWDDGQWKLGQRG
jgi:hypothetical protein